MSQLEWADVSSRNPFEYQRPLDPGQMINRDAEIERLRGLCDDGMLGRLDAPRRYGKTTLIRRVFSEAGNEGAVGILVDMKGVLTLADVILRVGRGYAAVRGPVRRHVGPLLAAIEAQFRVSFGGVGGGLRLSSPASSDEAALFALLDLPKTFMDRGWRPVIVAFDEFQDVLAVPAVDDKLRTVLQTHQGIPYIFAGSHPRLMNELFAPKTRAFWSQAERVELGPLAAADCAAYMSERFAGTGKAVGESLSALLRTGDGHPQRTMLLASKLWTATPDRGEATIERWIDALADAKLQVEPELDAAWQAQTQNAQRVLRAVALNDGRPNQQPAPQAVGVAPGSIDSLTKRLAGEAVLRGVEPGRFAFVDPMFGLYVEELGRDG